MNHCREIKRPPNAEKIYFPVDFLSFLYYIKVLNSAGKLIFRKAKKMNSRAGPRGSNKEVSGTQKRRPEAGGQRVVKRWKVRQQWWKAGQKAVDRRSESGGNQVSSGGKRVSKQKKGLSIAPKGSP